MIEHSFKEGIEYAREVLARLRKAILRPPPRMNVPDWADTYRYLSSSVGAVGGRWQTHRVEVARGPMMAVTEPGVEDIAIMSCTQIMKTEVLLNTIGYLVHLDPSPILLLEPKDDMAQAFSKERFIPLVNSSPVLQDLFDTRTRNSEDTILNKKFPGGFIAMSSAGSPSNLAMRAIRAVLQDEIDKYETTKEGDPVILADERSSTFQTSAIKIKACSPTWVETSRIYKAFMEGDQRKPFCACPHCGHEQTLDFFKHVLWEKTEDGEAKPETAAIYCESCGAAWSEADRVRIMTTKGAIRYYQTRPFVCGCEDHEGNPHNERQDPMETRKWEWVDDGHTQVGYALCVHCGERKVSNARASYTASKLYSPWLTIVGLVKAWLAAKGDPESKQTFYNTQLGLPFAAEVQKEANHHALAERAEIYGAQVPAGVVVLTAGIDVQAGSAGNLGRIECEVVGWGLGEESWSIEAKVFSGDPAKPHVWAELDAYLLTGFKHELGFTMGILAGCIDSGGHNTQEVYTFAKARIGRNIWAIKGASDRSGQWSPIWPPLEKERQHKKFRTGYRPVILGVNAAKESIRQKLLVEDEGPSYCHFPVGRADGWYEQLTSESLVVENRGGTRVRSWKLRKGLANEALDTRVYAYAALHGLYHARRFKLQKAAVQLAHYNPPPAMAAGALAAPAGPPARKVGRSAFMGEG
jgi:phage terminase large subunit GpA-like protein